VPVFSNYVQGFALGAAAAPFGIPARAFWSYVCAALVLLVGLIQIRREIPLERGIGKILPFGRLFFAIPIAVFGSEHFTLTASIAKIVPRWIPGPTFWVYLVGAAFLCAGLSMASLVQGRLAGALVGMTMLTFVLLMDLPAAVAKPDNRFAWALALRQLAFSGGGFALAIAPWSTLRRAPSAGKWAAVPRLFIGVPALFYGVEHLLHPEFAPGVPLPKLSPEWIHGRIVASELIGVALIVAGVCLVINKKTRLAATGLGLTILVAVLWIYTPMLLAAPTDQVAINFFFDTLLFCGAILLLAKAAEAGTR
jgi:uncharacterized membrane protein